MSSTIADNVVKTWSIVDHMLGNVDLSIANLKDVVGDYKSKLKGLSTIMPRVDKPQFPNKPSFAALVLDTIYPDGYIPDPNMRDFGNLDIELVAPTPPAEVSQGFSWTAKNYTSEMWQVLFSTVHRRILSGGYGLSQAEHAALISMEQEARRRNQDREFRVGLDALGESGFNLAGGHIESYVAWFQGEVLKRDQDSLNNITVKCFDLVNEREKFFIGSGIDMEKMLQASFEKAEDRSLDAAKAEKEYVLRFLAENIKLFLGKIEGNNSKLTGLKTRVEAIASINKNETDVFLARNQALEARYKSISEKNRGIVDAREGEVKIYATEVAAIKDAYLALIEEVRLNQDALAKQIDREIAIENIDLTAFVERAKLVQTLGLGVSNIWSQGLASTLGAMNWTMSNSYSGGESKTVSIGGSLNESHSYEHDPES